MKLTKLAAAARQIDAAIRSLKAEDYDVAITLAGAAEGMLPQIPPTGFSVILDQLMSRDPEPSRRDGVSIINAHRDWLKHRTSDYPDEMEFIINVAAHMIFRATSALPSSAWSDSMASFKVWYQPWVKNNWASS